MNSKLILVGVVCIAANSGCGDPREAFVGTYQGTGNTFTRFSDGTTDTYAWGAITVVVTAPDGTGDLDLGSTCNYVGVVTGGLTFDMRPKVCPREKFDWGTGDYCYSQVTILDGSGVLSGETLSMTYHSTVNITGCTDGSPNDLAQNTNTLTATR